MYCSVTTNCTVTINENCFNVCHSYSQAKNIKIFSFTNQPGIADGIATVADFVQELEGFGFDL
jgi:hypothetical protein